MSSQGKHRRVKYVVGDNFGQPIVVEHIVTVSEEVVVMAPSAHAGALMEKNGGRGKSKRKSKRHCGQSQRSARIAKKQREKK